MSEVTTVPGMALSRTVAVYVDASKVGALSLASAIVTVTVAVEDSFGEV